LTKASKCKDAGRSRKAGQRKDRKKSRNKSV
jgi:hypothetical protein